jgi:hypothetical protein
VEKPGERNRRLVVSSACLYSVARTNATGSRLMKLKIVSCFFLLFTQLLSAAFGQTAVAAAPAPQGAAVSYASVSELNGLLAQLEAASKATQVDLAKLRIERWKTDGGSKKRSLSDADSVQRNLQNALPEMVAQLRNAPEDLAATFRLYRNLDALYDVLGSVVESTGAFGSKDDLQALSNDLNSFEATRKQIAGRMESLASSKEQEIVRLRSDLKTAQAAIPAAPPKITVVDDNEPAKKPAVKKKPVAKKPAAPSTPPAQSQPQ